MDFIHTNLRFLRKMKSLTQEELAGQLNVKRSVIGAYEEGRAKPNYELLQQLSAMFSISIDHLITLDLRHTEKVPLFGSDQPAVASPAPMKILAITVDDQDRENIELVPVKAAAGYLAGYSDPAYLKELNRFRLPFLPSGTYRAFEIKGDSMLPVQPGSVIVGEYVENLQRIKDGQTYIILSRHDGIVFKRVFNQTEQNGQLLLRSDNPSYPPYTLPAEEILEVWKAVLHIGYLNKGSDLSFQQILNLMQEIKKDVDELKSN